MNIALAYERFEMRRSQKDRGRWNLNGQKDFGKKKTQTDRELVNSPL